MQLFTTQRVLIYICEMNFEILEVDVLSKEQKSIILKLWNNNYPTTLRISTINGFDEYLSTLVDCIHYLILDAQQAPIGWSAVFKRDDDQWFVIIIDEKIQYLGLGTRILNYLQNKYDRLCGWIIKDSNYIKKDESLYRTPTYFYQKNGFKVMNDHKLKTRKIEAVKILWTKK